MVIYGMVLRICSIIGFLVAFLFVAQVNAATTIPYQTRPPLQEYLPVDSSGNIRTQTTYETKAVTPTGQHVTRYTTKPTPISPSSLGKMAKGALTGPVGIGITAAIIAADYLIDENTGDIVVPAQTEQPTGTTGGYFMTQSDLNTRVSNPLTSCAIRVNNNNPNLRNVRTSPTYTNDSPYADCYSGGSYQGAVRFYIGQCPPNHSGYANGRCYLPADAPSIPQTTATDDQVGDAIITQEPFSNTRNIPNIIDDSVKSGRWRNEWPEAVTDSTTINDTLENDIEGATNPTTDPTVTDSATANPVPVQNTTNNNNQMAEEWPVFCTWAFYVCNFIDWVQEEPELPENPSLPYIEIEPEDYVSGLPSNGICPPDYPIDLGFGVVTMSYETPCNVAAASRPIVLIAAYLMAAFIFVGGIKT